MIQHDRNVNLCFADTHFLFLLEIKQDYKKLFTR